MRTPYIEIAKKEATLPDWLDTYIFEVLKGKYCRCNSDMTVI